MLRSKIMIAVLVLLSLLMAGAVSAGEPASSYSCAQPARLSVGNVGRVTMYPNLPNRLRSYPSYNGTILTRIPAGGHFVVIGGPHCESGLLWWQVIYNATTGWTAEGNGYNTYWLEPVSLNPPPPPTCGLTPRLTVGGSGRVLPSPSLPNVVRTAPGTTSSGANSVVIGEIPPGGVFSVLAGPQCGPDSRWWWQVNYNGLVGWTAEGEGYNHYWLEPWHNTGTACPGFLPSRLSAGGKGAVTSVPNLPNRVRSGPAFDTDSLGLIPVNGVFSVLSGPYCNAGTAWWQVNYYGLVGWTAEGQGSTYWLRPA
ncbi:MAG: hypothetical protein CL610_23720 [Anaerolineaceae bacterium]|nr:hypothetical protein [Anaerolineaceae bacterium]